MKKIFMILVFLPLFIFNNCTTREEKCIVNPTLSEAEIIAKQLQNEIDKYKFNMVSVVFWDEKSNTWVPKETCGGYELKSPFIQVCGTSYNLSKLVKYETQGGLTLYFKN
jgi:hypothetical protein